MVKLYNKGVYLVNGKDIVEQEDKKKFDSLGVNYLAPQEAKKNTIAYSILSSHNHSGNLDKLEIKFDALTSHDITYVGIIQTARASGLEKFPIPYVLTNCHNSLCAVGGTINQDDHMFGLSAAKKYGGIYVPANIAVIHQYMREMMAGCGKMILGSDSHTRYGALGTMAIGEGGGELVKQILNKTYNVAYPEVVGIYLKGSPKKGVGPMDVALTIIKNVFDNGFVKNKVMEFIGDGVSNLNVEYRNGIDVMTTETTCLSSIWATDDKVKEYLTIHNRANDYKELKPGNVTYYDSMLVIDLDKVECSIAMPSHPSNVYTIKDLNANMDDILNEVCNKAKKQNLNIDLKSKVRNGKLYAEQGIVAGCAGGTFDNIVDVRDILKSNSVGNGVFNLDIYPSSQATYLSLLDNGTITDIMSAGAILKTAFCGPCFGAGDVPANNQLSIRHNTRNFPNREGSNPSMGQMSYVALMDSRSIAVSAINGGAITAATEYDVEYTKPQYKFRGDIYQKVVYFGFDKANKEEELTFGPNIVDWPAMPELSDNIILKVASVINDPVTTTDELIPSGETSSYRSNPMKLSEFALFRRDPNYVKNAKYIREAQIDKDNGNLNVSKYKDLEDAILVLKGLQNLKNIDYTNISIGSLIYANKPGDGSAREQAASCQKVLGGWANIAKEYATKRYRSNLINWGILPFIVEEDINLNTGDFVFIPNIIKAIENKDSYINSYVVSDKKVREIKLSLPNLSKDEGDILLSGCLINYYRR